LARLDFTLTQQALSNLLLNAATHTPTGTAIGIEARHQDHFLELSVADNGHGLPPELLPKVFEKFFRAPSAPAGGSGLGLAIVKGFVKADRLSPPTVRKAARFLRFACLKQSNRPPQDHSCEQSL
jgi:two-component system sensor histidine kinase KdpD